MNGIFDFGVNWASLIDGIADDVHDSSQCFRSDWDTDRSSCIVDLLSSDETFSRIHSNGSYS